MNGQIESAKAVDVSAEEKQAIREFADETLRAEGETDPENNREE